MCTLIVLYRKIPGRWLVVAANRDEYLDRPSEAPAVRLGQEIPWLAPMDIRAGGTWLGLSQEGVFAALTNLREPNPDPARQSRGHVVMDSLQARSAEEALDSLMRIEPGIHNPFNVFVADQTSAHLVTYREEPRHQRIEPGVHVVGNSDPLEAGPGKGVRSKVDRVREEAEKVGELPAEQVVDALAGLCRSHGGRSHDAHPHDAHPHDAHPHDARLADAKGAGVDSVALDNASLDNICVHVGDVYGTRSSILIELSELSLTASDTDNRSIGGLDKRAISEGPISEGQGGRLLYAAGPPCLAPFEDYSSLLNELRQEPGYASPEFARGGKT